MPQARRDAIDAGMLESRDELITAILGKQLSRSPSHEAIDSQTLWAGCHVSRSMTEARGLVAAQHSSYRRISKCDTPRVAIHVDASSVYYARRVAAAVAVAGRMVCGWSVGT